MDGLGREDHPHHTGDSSEAYNEKATIQNAQRGSYQATAPQDFRKSVYAINYPRSSLPNNQYYASGAENTVLQSLGEVEQPQISGRHVYSLLNQQQYHYERPSPRYSESPRYPLVAFPVSASARLAAMALSYEDASYMQQQHAPRYPVMMHEQDPQEQHHALHQVSENRYPSPPIAGLSEDPYQNQAEKLDDAALNSPSGDEQPPPEDIPQPSPTLNHFDNGYFKPDRDVVKGENGRYTCTWVGCQEEQREFPRKCEWSKHMDKHDRPYKCREEGCEKLPGFTYSGGLLRHEREVHGKHGGPRKQLNCPHPNCKRHQGKGFSRQENLNEHLRRVHTDTIGAPQEQEIVEEDDEKTGQKRKRAAPRSTDNDIREEVKRLRLENDELRRSTDYMAAQIREMQQLMPQLHHQDQLQHSIQELQRHSMQEIKNGMPQARMQ